jgi:ribosome-associated heat shock protein Hsp15
MSGSRLDKWLWFARFAKTRSLAAKLCSDGHVTVGGMAVLKPSHPVRVGDALTVRQGRMLRRITIRDLGLRRGPAAEARQLYLDVEPPRPLRALERDAWVPLIADDGAELG